MAGLASLTLIGNLGGDPETVTSRNGAEFVKFRVGVNSYDKKNVSWFRVTCMGKQGEVASEYLHKGDQVCVIGDLQIQEYEGNDGETRTSAEVFCKTLTLIGGSRDGGSRDGGSRDGGDRDDERPRSRNQQSNSRGNGSRASAPAGRGSATRGRAARPFGEDDEDDDIPL